MSSVFEQRAQRRNTHKNNRQRIHTTDQCWVQRRAGTEYTTTAQYSNTTGTHLPNAHRSAACDLVTSCRMAVKKPCGLKKPVNQYELGLALFNQTLYCSTLSIKLLYHNPKLGLNQDSSAPLAVNIHDFGTRASKISSIALSKIEVNVTSPRMAN